MKQPLIEYLNTEIKAYENSGHKWTVMELKTVRRKLKAIVKEIEEQSMYYPNYINPFKKQIISLLIGDKK